MSHGQTVGYIRVSSIDQNDARQLDGVHVDTTFTDKASGKDVKRPQLKAMISHVREGDTVKVHSMDRLARSVVDLRKIVDELVEKGVQVEFIKEKLTFRKSTSGKKSHDDLMADLMLSMMGAIAEFERGIIGERQREGIEIAKKLKKYKGRKDALSAEDAKAMIARAVAGEAKSKLAEEFKISRASLYNYMARA